MDKIKETLMNESLNRHYNEIKAKNPTLTDEQILKVAVQKTMQEHKSLESNFNIERIGEKDFTPIPQNVIDTFGSLEPFGAGTIIDTTEDGSGIARVDHHWQQKKGSGISNDGFHKEGYSTITLPKEIDVNTPEGDKKAGDLVKQLKDAKRRGDKMMHEMKKQQWEDRKVQVTVNKEGV
tara:strand:+ start:2922 stop:3458 length:537 start_codon:yes stop_codon:yes gene_type:complete